MKGTKYLLSLGLLLLLACNPVEKISEGFKENITGNGGSYEGIRVFAPMIAQSGETIQVSYSGGTAPYDIQIAGSGEIIERGKDFVKVKFPEILSEDETNVFTVTDERGLQGKAETLVIALESGTDNTLSKVKLFGERIKMSGQDAFISFASNNMGNCPGCSLGESQILHFHNHPHEGWKLHDKINLVKHPDYTQNAYAQFHFVSYFEASENFMVSTDDRYGGDKIIVLKKGLHTGKFEFYQDIDYPENSTTRQFGQNLHLSHGRLFAHDQSRTLSLSKNSKVYVYQRQENGFVYSQTIEYPSQRSLGASIVFNGEFLFVMSESQVHIHRLVESRFELVQNLSENFSRAYSFDLSGDQMAIGVKLKNGKDAVNFYKLKNDRWIYENSLLDDLQSRYVINNFGRAVSFMRDDLIAVGSPQYSRAPREGEVNCQSCGYVGRVDIFKFESGEWLKKREIQAPDFARNHTNFGRELSSLGNALLIGAKRNNFVEIHIIED